MTHYGPIYSVFDYLLNNEFDISVTDSERRRLQDAFRRLGGGGGGSGGTVGKSVFVSDVLGAGFPAGLAGMALCKFINQHFAT